MVHGFLVQLAGNYKMQISASDAVNAPKKRLVAVNENGHRIGQDHPRAVLTDHEIDVLLELRDQGWGYRRLSEAFEISRTAAKRYCQGKMRAQFAARFKRV